MDGGLKHSTAFIFPIWTHLSHLMIAMQSTWSNEKIEVTLVEIEPRLEELRSLKYNVG